MNLQAAACSCLYSGLELLEARTLGSVPTDWRGLRGQGAERHLVRNADYCFAADWRFDAPRERVWAALVDPPGWGLWWPGLLAAETLCDDDAEALPCWRFAWRGRLPYTLRIEIRARRREPPSCIEGVVSGPVSGIGRWQLETVPGTAATHVHFEWHVSGPGWSRLLSPLLRRAFRRNFESLMADGQRGLAARLAEASSE